MVTYGHHIDMPYDISIAVTSTCLMTSPIERERIPTKLNANRLQNLPLQSWQSLLQTDQYPSDPL